MSKHTPLVTLEIYLTPEEMAELERRAITWHSDVSAIALLWMRAGRDLCTGRSMSAVETQRNRHTT